MPARPCRQPAPWRPRVRWYRKPARTASATRSGTTAPPGPRENSRRPRRRIRTRRGGGLAWRAAVGRRGLPGARRDASRQPRLHGGVARLPVLRLGVSRPCVVFGFYAVPRSAIPTKGPERGASVQESLRPNRRAAPARRWRRDSSRRPIRIRLRLPPNPGNAAGFGNCLPTGGWLRWNPHRLDEAPAGRQAGRQAGSKEPPQ